ncbi:hypothetical protein ACQ4PT_046640 [Festuca glaucescens]
MASNCWFLLPLLVFIQLPFSSAHGTPATSSVHCLPDQASSLLQLKQSFNFDFSNATLPSWQDGIDCCLWEGVGCEDSSGQVTALSLRGRGLYSKAINRALFNLTSLHHLDLSGNNFGGSHLPAVGFERLSLLTYLNLSDAYLCGQIPISIGYLTSLLSLDLSTHFGGEFGVFSQNMLVLWEPSFTALVANLTNLRELYLDSVDISASGEDWCNALARHVPHLEVLSLEDCGLSGPIDQSLSRVRSLNVINLSYNHISGAVPDLFADFLSLSVLQLGYCNFGGRIPPRIFQLNNLSVLDVSDNPNMLVHLPDFLNGSSLEILNMQGTNVSTTNPMSFSNLKSLEELSLDGEYRYIAELHPSSFMTLHKLHLSQLGSDSQISWVGDLKKLTNLEIFRSNFSRRAPSWIGNLTSLRSLQICMCIFSGSIPSGIQNLKNLTVLRLSDCGFSGRIPAWVANLTQLSYLNLYSNNLSALEKLDLSSNRLSGKLRDFPASSSLYLIELSDNELGGSIPKSIFQLKSLNQLFLGSNKFMDQVDLSSFLRLTNLRELDLSNNRLSVADGEGFAPSSTHRLQVLDLTSCGLTKVPESLQLLHVIYLDLSNNRISGNIPKWMWDKWSGTLQVLNLSHNMFSSMELSSCFLPTEDLISLDLSSNRLQGEIPIPLKSRSLRNQFLDYSNNSFSLIMKNCTSCLSQTTYLKMSNNRISGKIPEFICNTSKLQVLDLSNNSFSGTIPSCLIENGHLGILNLKDNDLEGRLALNIEKGCALQTINLNGNRIEGHLPRSLTNCKDLEFLDMGNNQIVDSFPYWLGKLPKLRVLVLRSNQLHGSIGNPPGDDNNEQFSSLHIIDVASNNLSGNLTSQWFEKFQSMIKSSDFTGDIMEDKNLSGPYGHYQDIVTVMFKGQYITFQKIWTTLAMIDLSDNALRGGIPESVGELSQLHGLNLSHNTLTGEIPPALGSMTNLESLDLSSNELSGKIPEELTNLTSLGTLNLSNNQLMGKIPETRQFGTFQNNSYFGNKGLCGAPLFIQCGSTDGPVEARRCNSSGHVDVILFLFVGLGFGFGFAAAILMKWRRVGEWYKTVVTSRG